MKRGTPRETIMELCAEAEEVDEYVLNSVEMTMTILMQ